MDVDLNTAPEALLNKGTVYNPAMERHLRQVLGSNDYTLRDIKKGEEILCNYLEFIGNRDEWKKEVLELRDMCSGEAGDISEYEMEHV